MITAPETALAWVGWIYLGCAVIAFLQDAWKAQVLWPEEVDWTIVPSMLLLFLLMVVFNLLWPIRVAGWLLAKESDQ